MSVNTNYSYGAQGRYFLTCLVDNKAMNGAEKIKLCAMDRLEILMSQFEKALDWGGIIPGVNLLSSATRFLYGTTQLVVAVACKVVAAFGTTFAEEKDIGYWEKFHNRASHHVWQGGVNQLRALGEVTPLINLFWIPSVLMRDKLGLKSSIWMSGPSADKEPVKLFYNRVFYEGELKLKHIVNNLT